MFIVPAIDIKDGKCVRLLQGDFNKVTTYSDNPLAVAKKFAQSGAQLLHIIDLDGARSGTPVNQKLILAIVSQTTMCVQVGGGIRSYQSAKAYLDGGVQRIILSTAVIENAELARRLIAEFGRERIVIAVDIKNGRFATDGWTKSGGKSVDQSIALLKKLGANSIVVTDIAKDGVLAGPNFALTQRFIDAGLQVMAAGGVSTLADAVELQKRGAYGVIVGKAAYEGSMDITAAQAAVSFRNKLAKRLIPCLDVKGSTVVKGTHFKNLKAVGDPVTLAKKYSESGADELTFLDIAATLEERKTFRQLVEKIAQAINIPFTVGGGISSLDDIRLLLQAGADKVSIGSAAVLQPEFIQQAADYFGSQCLVVSVDAKKQNNRWVVYIKGGSQATDIDVMTFCEDMERAGAGELLVNSLDRDGMNNGFDIELLRLITERVNIPVIASSGGGSPEDFVDVFEQTNVDAALGASIFHYQNLAPSKLKNYLARAGVEVRT